MKALLEVVRYDLADVITTSGEVVCTGLQAPAPVGELPEERCGGEV